MHSISIRKRLYKICYIIFFTLLTCCKSEQVIDSSDSFLWDCSSQINETMVSIDDIFSSLHTIGLEETDNSLVGNITKVISCDSTIAILDGNLSKKIFLFNPINGQFIKAFGTTGNGPGEYITIEDISFDSNKKKIYALCNNNKIITYNLSGELLEEKKLDFTAYALEYLNDYFYLLSHDLDKGELVVLNENLKFENSYFDNSNNDLPHQLVHGLIKNQESEILLSRYLDNNIYSVRKTEPIKIKYIIDFGENELSRNQVKESESNIKNLLSSKRGYIKYFIENDNNAIIVFFDKMRPCISIFDKSSNASQSYYLEAISDSGYTLSSPIEFCINQNLVSVTRDNLFPVSRLENPKTLIGDNPVLYLMK